MDELIKNSTTEINNLRSTKQKLEEANKVLHERVGELARKLQLYREGGPGPLTSATSSPALSSLPPRPAAGPKFSTGPTQLPPRPSGSSPGTPGHSRPGSVILDSKQLNQELSKLQKAQTLTPGRPSPPASGTAPPSNLAVPPRPTRPANALRSAPGSRGPSPPKERPEPPRELAPTSFVSVPSEYFKNQTFSKSVAGVTYDLWEGASKIVLSIDLPGSDADMMDITIGRFSVQVTRKIGEFEKKYLVGKYKPVKVHRLALPENEGADIGRIVRDEITLPVPVQPHKKQAYNFHGTIYITLEKLDSPVVALRGTDLIQAPTF